MTTSARCPKCSALFESPRALKRHEIAVHGYFAVGHVPAGAA